MFEILKKTSLLALMFFIFSLSLYLCETYLNITGFKSKQAFLDFANIGKFNLFTLDSDLVYKATINQFRDPIKVIMPNNKSIAFVGDSATFSYGAKNGASYPITFEKLFNKKHPNKPAIVNNFGIPGYGIDQEFLFIKKYVLSQYQPNILVWNINVNDIWDSNYMCLYVKNGNQWSQISGKNNISYWYGWAKAKLPKQLTDSKLFNFIWQRTVNTIIKGGEDDRYTFGCTTTNMTTEVKNNIIEKLVYFISDLGNEIQKNNGQLIITLIPYQSVFDNRININDTEEDYLILEKTLSNLKINFIDFNKILVNYPTTANPSDEYFLNSSTDVAPYGLRHPNQKLYDLMAQSLNDYIISSKLTF